MSSFEKKVEQLIKDREQRRLAAFNLALQKSLRERTVEEVYESIYSGLGIQKSPVVLA